ncbi:uracil-DNA glycosylase [Nematocida sp. AWRm77]|nr:uracil-DNA glycosylase [Nematocida sp. AWRm77]
MSFECSCAVCCLEEQMLPGWKALLKEEFAKEYFKRIVETLHTEAFFPEAGSILRCLSFFECAETKVVVLGQDPYHGAGQAEGLSFSVPAGVTAPPSLANIKKEIFSSTGKASVCKGGSLVPWAEQGVLLLNTTLTVREKQPRSHAGLLWSLFTDRVIECISEHAEHVVFFLWGKDAEKKRGLIDSSRHLVLSSPHPSPFSARRGFFGNNHFQLTNEYLLQHQKEPVVW